MPFKSIDCEPLVHLLKQALADQAELAKLDQIEDSSKAEIEAVLQDGKIEDEKEQKRLSNARLRLDLVPARRKRLAANLAKITGELRTAFRQVARAHDTQVRACREEVVDRLALALKPFFPDTPDRRLRQIAEGLNSPATDLRKLFSHTDGGQVSEAHVVTAVEQFIGHTQRVARKLGWE